MGSFLKFIVSGDCAYHRSRQDIEDIVGIKGEGRGILPCRAPQPTRESRKRRKLPSRVRGGASTENEFGSFEPHRTGP